MFGARRTVLAGALVIVAFGGTLPASAAMEEVYVIAEKPEGNLQEVPISMSVVAGSELSISSVCVGDDLYRIAPNLSLNQKSPVKSGLAVRRVGTELNMPVQDGVEATIEIRNRMKMADINIIAITANIEPVEVDRYLACGMNEHVAKPFDVDDLIDKMSRYVA